MKKVITSLLAAAMIGSTMLGALPMAGAAYSNPAVAANKTVNESITYDGNLEEWTTAEKNYMSVYQNGTLTLSNEYYVSFKWSDDRLFMAMVVPDGGKTVNGGIRDSVRMAFRLPDGTVSYFYVDNDGDSGWVRCADGTTNVLSWCGDKDDTTSILDANNTGAKYVYKDGKAYIEVSMTLQESRRTALVQGNKIGVAVRYHDNAAFNAVDGDNILVWGDDDLDFTNNYADTASVTPYGEVTLGTVYIPYTKPSVTANKVDNASVAYDGNLVEWGTTEKSYMSVYENDTLTVSEEYYVQFKWSDDRLFMAMVVPDGGKTVDGGIRDSVRMAFRLPDGTVSYFYVDSDGDNGWVRTDDKNPNNVLSWCGDKDGTVSILGNNNTGAKYVYKDGKAYIEVSTTFREEYRSALTKGNTIGVAVRYHDNAAFNAINGDNILVWGDNDLDFTTGAADFGSVVLGDAVSSGGTDQGDGHTTPLGVNKVDLQKGSAMIDGIEDVIWKNVDFFTPEIANNFQHAPANWGPTDTTGKWKAMWDDKGIYFWVEVTDSTKNVTCESGQTSDKDSIIVYIDQNNDDDGPYGAENPAKTGASPFLIGANGECFGSGNGMMQGADLNIATTETETGYIYEGFIGWTISETAQAGNYIGLDIDINDNIDGNQRGAVVFWNTLNIASGNWNLTNGYADAKLVDSGMGDTPEIIEKTTDAKVSEPETLPDGTSKQISWEATPDAYEYQINLFSLNDFDPDEKFFVATYKVYDETSFAFTDLALDTSYQFQILAYDASGELLAAYAPGEFSTKFEDPGENTDPGENPDPENPDGNDPSIDTDTPAETGVDFSIWMLMLFGAAGAVLTVIRKKRLN